MTTFLQDQPLTRLDGRPDRLGAHLGQVLLIVNVASACGLTPQYAGLQALHAARHPAGLQILAFPSNDFGGQEPGAPDEIAAFCSREYGVAFPLFEKTPVTGPARHPLFTALATALPRAQGGEGLRETLRRHGIEPNAEGELLWNFEKFVVGRDGRVLARFAPDVAPDDPALLACLDAALAAPAPPFVHPQSRALLDALAQMLPPVDWATATAQTVRATFGGPSAFAPGDEVAAIEDRSIPGPGGPLRLRLYRPLGEAPAAGWPVTVFCHGGGFVMGAPEGHDNVCRCLAQRAGTLVVSVDYRLAPEARFPAAVHDAMAALQWVHAQAGSIGGDAARIAVAGDSAGGNLAAVLALQAPGAGIALRHQLLFYPVTDAGCGFASYRHFADGYLLSAPMMQWFWRQYLPHAGAGDDPLASPLRAPDLHGLAPATLVLPGLDPLGDEGRAYARRLVEAGTPVTVHEWPGQIHGFASMLGALDAAQAALNQGADALRRAFG
jgi:acetyl esterase